MQATIVIHGDGAQLRQRYLLQPGENCIVDLPRTADLGSIVAINEATGATPQLRIAERASIQDLIDDSINNNDQADDDEVTVLTEPGARQSCGRLLRFDGKSAIVQEKHFLALVQDARSILWANPPHFNDRPLVTIEAASFPQTVMMSTMVGQVSWQARATAILQTDTERGLGMRFCVSAHIRNQSGTVLEGSVSLLSGQPLHGLMAMDCRTSHTRKAAWESGFGSDADSSPASSIGDDYKFFVTAHNKVKPGTTISELFTIDMLGLSKFYLHDTNVSSKDVMVAYEGYAPRYIPACTVQLFDESKVLGIGDYLGQCNLAERQPLDRIELVQGLSSKVQVHSTTTKAVATGETYDILLIARITNRSNARVIVVVRHDIKSRELVKLVTQPLTDTTGKVMTRPDVWSGGSKYVFKMDLAPSEAEITFVATFTLKNPPASSMWSFAYAVGVLSLVTYFFYSVLSHAC